MSKKRPINWKSVRKRFSATSYWKRNRTNVQVCRGSYHQHAQPSVLETPCDPVVVETESCPPNVILEKEVTAVIQSPSPWSEHSYCSRGDNVSSPSASLGPNHQASLTPTIEQLPLLQQPSTPVVLHVEAPTAPPLAPVTSASSSPKFGEKTASQQVLEEIVEFLKVDPFWSAKLEGNEGLRVSLHSRDSAGVTQRTILFRFSGEVQVFVHGQELRHTSHLVSLSVETLHQFVKEVIQSISEIRLKEICIGVNDPKFKVWWKSYLETCHVDTNKFHETRYETTLRSNQCDYLIDLPRKFCGFCYKIVKNMKKKKSPAKATTMKKTPNKFKPNKCLSSGEKRARFNRKAKDIRNLQRRIARLTGKVEALIVAEGRTIDSPLNCSLGKALEKGLTDLKAKESTDPKDKFLKLFVEQQLAARNAKGNHGIKWHPLMIRFALQLKFCAQSSINAARNFIRLPSDRLLWDYTHIYEAKPGIQQDFINEVAERVLNSKYSYQHFHVLLFDEMTIKEKLVQKKGSGEVIEYVKLNEVQTELEELKDKLLREAEHTSCNATTPLVAKKMLTYMVRGTSIGTQHCVASYPVHSLKMEDLYQYTWEVTSCLETSGVKVVAFVADGSPVNRAFFQMHPSKDQTKSGLIYSTPNPFDLQRSIFLIPDPPHALKTGRNCLENSGRKKSRCMVKNGETLTWKPIIRLFKWKSEQTIKKLPRLTAACVYLNSFSRMSVPYACKVFSHSVAAQLKLLGWPQTRELSVFGSY